MAALLELGAGFHPELSGRENVYLNGSILGLKRVEVDRVFDDIVGFAELEQFIDTPVKHYSSGMYVRLGFAVAINVDPEILLVDEVLSVGDEAFQRKCIDKVKAFQAEGRTIVVVTHAADLVRQMCDKAAALDHGVMVAEGDPNEVIREFRERLLTAATPAEDMSPELARSEMSPMWGRVKIADVRIVYATPDQEAAAPGEPMQIEVTLEAPEPVDDVVVGHRHLQLHGLARLRHQHRHPRRRPRHGRPAARTSRSTAPTCPCSTAPTPSPSGSTPRAGSSTTAGSSCAASRWPPRAATSASCACPSTSRSTESSPRTGSPQTGDRSVAGGSPRASDEPLVPVEHGVPGVLLLDEAPAGRAEARPERASSARRSTAASNSAKPR